MTRERIQTRKTPIPAPVVHAREPYTRRKWKLDVSHGMRAYLKHYSQMWKYQDRYWTKFSKLWEDYVIKSAQEQIDIIVREITTSTLRA